MKRSLALIMLLMAGCMSAPPFKDAALVPLENADPGTVVERFKNESAGNYQLLNTIVFL